MTDGWAYIAEGVDLIALAFRGMSSIKNWDTDFNVALVHPENTDLQLRVHKGFYQAFIGWGARANRRGCSWQRSGCGLLHLWLAARRQFLFRSMGEGSELSGDELRGYCSAGSVGYCLSPFRRSSLHAGSPHAVALSVRAESFRARLANDPRVNSTRQSGLDPWHPGSRD